jgi:hypothetical protein
MRPASTFAVTSLTRCSLALLPTLGGTETEGKVVPAVVSPALKSGGAADVESSSLVSSGATDVESSSLVSSGAADVESSSLVSSGAADVESSSLVSSL